MASDTANQLALRAHLLTLEVCTTGLIDLSATATGYARPNGSFIADGFAVGMEVTPTGFTQTTVALITDLTALTMTVQGGRSAQAEAPSRSLTVGLPERRGWQNETFDPDGLHPFIEEEYVPATRTLLSCPSDGGTLERVGLYVIRWYAQAGKGLGCLSTPAEALCQHFRHGTQFADGLAVINPAPSPSGIRADTPGWAVNTVRIVWRQYAVN